MRISPRLQSAYALNHAYQSSVEVLLPQCPQDKFIDSSGNCCLPRLRFRKFPVSKTCDQTVARPKASRVKISLADPDISMDLLWLQVQLTPKNYVHRCSDPQTLRLYVACLSTVGVVPPAARLSFFVPNPPSHEFLSPPQTSARLVGCSEIFISESIFAGSSVV